MKRPLLTLVFPSRVAHRPGGTPLSVLQFVLLCALTSVLHGCNGPRSFEIQPCNGSEQTATFRFDQPGTVFLVSGTPVDPVEVDVPPCSCGPEVRAVAAYSQSSVSIEVQDDAGNVVSSGLINVGMSNYPPPTQTLIFNGQATIGQDNLFPEGPEALAVELCNESSAPVHIVDATTGRGPGTLLAAGACRCWMVASGQPATFQVFADETAEPPLAECTVEEPGDSTVVVWDGAALICGDAPPGSATISLCNEISEFLFIFIDGQGPTLDDLVDPGTCHLIEVPAGEPVTFVAYLGDGEVGRCTLDDPQDGDLVLWDGELACIPGGALSATAGSVSGHSAHLEPVPDPQFARGKGRTQPPDPLDEALREFHQLSRSARQDVRRQLQGVWDAANPF